MAVEPVDEPPADDARLVSWAGPAFILFSIVLIPWTIYLGFNLPDRQESSQDLGTRWIFVHTRVCANIHSVPSASKETP